MSRSAYDSLRHTLDTEMVRASSLKTEMERRGFVNRMFTSLHKASEQKQVSHAEYVRLINRLAAYAGGAFNDYLDVLAGAASVGMGMLELTIQGELSQATPEAARQRSQAVTDMTGIELVEPEE